MKDFQLALLKIIKHMCQKSIHSCDSYDCHKIVGTNYRVLRPIFIILNIIETNNMTGDKKASSEKDLNANPYQN